MQEDKRLSHVEVLLQQRRFEDAERIAKELLMEDSNNVYLLLLFSEININLEKYVIAQTAVETVISLDPNNAIAFYLRSKICFYLDQYDEAETFLKQAIQLDPFDADFFSFYANLRLIRKEYQDALDLANKALEIDSENLVALNARSSALIKLNRKSEAFETIEGALREDPNDSYTHANYGWGYLEDGNHKKALEHFQISLQNNPNSEYAQSGMLEAIKAGNPVYRLFLRYSFFINNLKSKYQWAVIFGFYIGVKFLRFLSKKYEVLQPFLWPIIILLSAIAFSTWIIEPLGNLFLRFNKYGQLLLGKKERTTSNFVALSLFVFVVGTIFYLITGNIPFLSVTILGLTMMMPTSVMLLETKPKNALLYYTLALVLLGLLFVFSSFISGELLNNFGLLYLLGIFGLQWVANSLLIRENNR